MDVRLNLPQVPGSESGCCAEAVCLADATPGQTGIVCHTLLDEQDAEMLRAMGLRPRAWVRVCRVGEPCIIEIMGGAGCASRIGLARPLARLVLLSQVCEA